MIEGKDNIKRIIITRKDSAPKTITPIEKKQMSVDVLMGGLLTEDADLVDMGLTSEAPNGLTS